MKVNTYINIHEYVMIASATCIATASARYVLGLTKMLRKYYHYHSKSWEWYLTMFIHDPLRAAVGNAP